MERLSNVKDNLTVNTKLNVAEMMSSKVYDTRVEEVNDDSFLIGFPTDRGQPMPISLGVRLEFNFISAGGRFYFTGRVINRVNLKIQMLEIELPEYIDKSELREFFRIDILQKIKLYKISSKVDDYNSKTLARDFLGAVFCMDISGGGVRIFSELPFYGVHDVEIDFDNAIEGLGVLSGVIVRNIKRSDGKHDIGIRFNTMKDADRDKIIKFVFRRQIEMRKLSKK